VSNQGGNTVTHRFGTVAPLLLALSLLLDPVCFAGTPGPARLIKDINQTASFTSGSFPTGFVDIGDTTLFLATLPTTGSELWKTDGTEGGTVLVKDIFPGPSGSVRRDLFQIDGVAFFAALDPVHGVELWKSDGTEAGTVLVKDIRPGSDSSLQLPLNLDQSQSLIYTALNGNLIFLADDGTRGLELWRSDGTEAGTILLKDILPGLSSSVNQFGRLV